MANPKFNGNAFLDAAPRSRRDPVQTRVYTETLPGVNGAFVQTHGYGAQDYHLQGIVKGSAGATRALARANLRTRMNTLEAYADGVTVATFVDTDATSCDNCILLSLAPMAAQIHYMPSGGNWIAFQFVAARVRHLAP